MTRSPATHAYAPPVDPFSLPLARYSPLTDAYWRDRMEEEAS